MRQPHPSHRIADWCLAGFLLLLIAVACRRPFADDTAPAPTPSTDARAALERLNDLIGGWRGVGQPRRGSSRGAWRETAEWAWDFSKETPALVITFDDGKLLETARLTYDMQAHRYRLEARTRDEQTRTYTGGFEKERLVLQADPDSEDNAHRLTITPLNEKRTLILFESRPADRKSWYRVAEVGYTRAGTRLAIPGGGRTECIVTGGAGTIPVQHNGQTYYVCCSGCKIAFEDDPQGIIDEFQARLRERKRQAG
ncbi:YHS domain protein [Maioricimonas rarisocia]|uniref:YHS domain protein n=1 Tax=Maioricimonas rarisocia TaxID=2528026 RepID=A0A517Z0N7_9PLAN|nr:hypothetical protein [Maioricimonas rarisocia]QDU36046.1 YHS domain protein [Maioricimonas rarisocia]